MVINVENKALATIVSIIKQQIAVYDVVMFSSATTQKEMSSINSDMKDILTFFSACENNMKQPSSTEVVAAMNASGIEYSSDCEAYDDGFLDGVRWMHERFNLSPDPAI